MTTLLPAPTGVAVRLVEPLPGFDEHLDFTLNDIDPDGVLLALRSVADPALRFVLTPAEVFFEGYRPELGVEVTAALGVPDGTALRILLLLTIDGDLSDATANLRAPIVLAVGGSAAVQVVLDDETLSMREPVVPGSLAD